MSNQYRRITSIKPRPGFEAQAIELLDAYLTQTPSGKLLVVDADGNILAGLVRPNTRTVGTYFLKLDDKIKTVWAAITVDGVKGEKKPVQAAKGPFWLASSPSLQTHATEQAALLAASRAAKDNPGTRFLVCSVHKEVTCEVRITDPV